MAKFNHSTARSRAGVGPIKSEQTASTTTFNGAAGYVRDEKSELFLAAVSDFGGEGAFYESAEKRSARIAALTAKVAVADPEWIAEFTQWLRNEANLRTISLTIALEGAKALNKAGIPGGRAIVSGAIRRADEPGEALAWWLASEGRKIPSSVKRGIADAFVRTTNEFSLARYDTSSHAFRFGDIIEMTHPAPKDEKQSALFKHALERRRNAGVVIDESLELLRKRAEVLGLSVDEKRKLITSKKGSDTLKEAGLTWETVAGSFGKGGLDAKTWEALIPSMGYMALIRNLRNFQEKGVDSKVLDRVATRLSDAEEVAKSRQLPFRFLSAHRATSGNLRFGYPLEQALDASLANIPSLKGDTLILVDRSGSMFHDMSKNTDLTYADTAAVFGTALALRAEKATLVEFGSSSNEISFRKGDSVLPIVGKFKNLGGTATYDAIKKHFVPGKHTRVILLTDEQANGYYHRLNGGNRDYWSGYDRIAGNVMDALPESTPAFIWNFGGYTAGQGKSGPNRTYMGGLSDQAFKMIPLLEQGYDSNWPWEINAKS